MRESQTSGTVRCAVYTRKSSEEGLEQSFNSLHAQREACEAYIRSQKHEGWTIATTAYDDGGFSGGTMDRPALRSLMDDVRAGRVNVVVVYKIDRLTRSLFDFAKIVEVLDAAGASFVSVTQSFNTTTSMGRLTLNVLLSFAQFEREVTGERIRDKIAASKRRGMWMGGNIPFGYDLVARKLEPNDVEATTVRVIFESYTRLGSVRLLKQELDRLGLRTKRREQQAADGSKRVTGGLPFGIGHLYTILRNPIYLGKVRHRREVHPGEHAAIVSEELWSCVQDTLDAQAVKCRSGKGTKHPSLLTGILFTADGRRLTPTHAAKGSKRYRYYATSEAGPDGSRLRLSADDVEQLVCQALKDKLVDASWLADLLRIDAQLPPEFARIIAQANAAANSINPTAYETVQPLILRAEIAESAICINLDTVSLADAIGLPSGSALQLPKELRIECHTVHQKRGRDTRLILTTATDQRQPDATLVTAILRARRWFELLRTRQVNSIADLGQREGVARAWISNQLALTFLAPAIIRGIIAGQQPPTLTLDRMVEIANASPDWSVQQRAIETA
jgi:site-specific DNA recombinase